MRELWTTADFEAEQLTRPPLVHRDVQTWASELFDGYRAYFDYTDGSLGKATGTSYDARCVRGAPLPPPSWTANGDGTATDSETGLTWQTTLTLGKAPDYAAAQAHCAALTLRGGGFRVPTLSEFQGILTLGAPPWLEPVFMPTVTPSFWTSTAPFEAPTTARWIVDFADMDFLFQSLDVDTVCAA